MNFKSLLGGLSSLGSGQVISILGGKIQVQSALKPALTKEAPAPANSSQGVGTQGQVTNTGKVKSKILWNFSKGFISKTNI